MIFGIIFDGKYQISCVLIVVFSNEVLTTRRNI